MISPGEDNDQGQYASRQSLRAKPAPRARVPHVVADDLARASQCLDLNITLKGLQDSPTRRLTRSEEDHATGM